MHNTGCLGLVHWDDPEGWNGEGGGRRVQDGDPIAMISERNGEAQRVQEFFFQGSHFSQVLSN